MIFSDRPNAKLLKLEELADVPKITLDGYKACKSWKKAQGNPKTEAEYKKRSIAYNDEIVTLLDRFQANERRNIDLIVLGGYMRFVEAPLLESYRDRIINVHPADLTILDHNRKREYIGEDAVFDALEAGELVTRSSVIMVDEREDHGEIITQGPKVRADFDIDSLPVMGRGDMLRFHADAHQDRQKEISDWPALTTALKMIAEGRVALGDEKTHFNEWRNVYVDKRKQGYGGYEVK